MPSACAAAWQLPVLSFVTGADQSPWESRKVDLPWHSCMQGDAEALGRVLQKLEKQEKFLSIIKCDGIRKM